MTKQARFGMRGANAGWWKLRDILQDGPNGTPVDFNGPRDSLIGRWVTGTLEVGRLPDEYLSPVQSARYIIYSYGTPIAWMTCKVNEGNRWVTPEVKYSLTTTRHQTQVFTAISQLRERVS